MKQIRLIAAALGALALAACSSSDEVFTAPEELAQLEANANAIQFGTYLGRGVQTRSGYEGAITTATLKSSEGFGVFAYYTGTKSYAHDDVNNKEIKLAPNFMHNQQVKWETATDYEGYVSRWQYAPLKFWPNEVGAGGVDDQDADNYSDPATTENLNGGNLTFFAYAPYVESAESGSEGITAINASVGTEPIISYKVAADANKTVDLLWGTYGTTSANVNNTGNVGLASTANSGSNPVVTAPLSDRNGQGYQADILENYTVNADLTKQKTNGKVDFAFKHALAKVGGYTPETTEKVNAGLMVILDVDDQKGAEKGGSILKETIEGETQSRTKVTIKSINIKARSQVRESGIDKYLQGAATGNFNLATGKWFITSSTTANQEEAAVTDYNITVGGDDGKLNSNLAESGVGTTWKSVPAGVVTNAAQNVYNEAEAKPLVFIPGTKPELTVTIDYIVRTYDAKLPAVTDEGRWTKVEQAITKKVTFANPVELNKQYSLLIHLGLTSVKFEASVSDWDRVGSVTNGASSVTISETQEVNLPINVGGISFASGTKKVVVDGDYTKGRINISGLTASTTYTVSVTSGSFVTAPATFKTGAAQTDYTIPFEIAENKGTANKVFTFTVYDGSTTQTIDITQTPQPLSATLSSSFSSSVSNSGISTATDLLSTLKDASEADVLSGSVTLSKVGTADWITISGKQITVAENAAGSAERSAKIRVTVGTASTVVTVSQEAGPAAS